MSFENNFNDQSGELDRSQTDSELISVPRELLHSQNCVTRADRQIWADEGALPRSVAFKRHNLEFEQAIDGEKVAAMLAWNDR